MTEQRLLDYLLGQCIAYPTILCCIVQGFRVKGIAYYLEPIS